VPEEQREQNNISCKGTDKEEMCQLCGWYFYVHECECVRETLCVDDCAVDFGKHVTAVCFADRAYWYISG